MEAIIKVRKEILEIRNVIDIKEVTASILFEDKERKQIIKIKDKTKYLVETQKVEKENFKMKATVEIKLDKYDYLIIGDRGYAAFYKEDIVIVEDELKEAINKIAE